MPDPDQVVDRVAGPLLQALKLRSLLAKHGKAPLHIGDRPRHVLRRRYNVDGHPVFIASIKDMNRNLKMIGAVSAQDRSVVAVGDTVRDALSNLSRPFAVHGYAGTVATGGEARDWTGKVARIGHEVVDGETRWFLTLESDPGHIFAVPTSLPVAVMPLLRTGDNVVIEAVDNGQKALSAQSVRTVAPPPAEVVEVVEEEDKLLEE